MIDLGDKTNIHSLLDESNYFMTKDGRTIKNLKELALVMEHLAQDVFEHHVSENKNDFASWIKDVIKDENLAGELMKSFDKDGHQRIIFRHIIKNFIE
ncbi:hypothetical protein COV93_05790 [Candidatus Woesearchaeota archaeon CG11_big_fil_rev_8_21_14_0_20_43_8]|nr:MAG: hypothetical protein COV93_05790 [Candidatus Woesearchaeota archaeon CG11_big_fil_rev_8_21_14_0_20_43_8]